MCISKLTCYCSEIKNLLNAYAKHLNLHISSDNFLYFLLLLNFIKIQLSLGFLPVIHTNSFNHYASKMAFNLLNKILKIIAKDENDFIINNN